MNRYVTRLLLVACYLLTALPAGATEIVLSHQGRLLDASSAPVADGPHTATYSIWADSTGGLPLWEETQQVVTRNGLFSVLLGNVSPLPLSLFEQQPLYFSVTIAGTELLPRLALGTVPAAATAHRLNGDITTGPGVLTLESGADGTGAELSARGKKSKAWLEQKDSDVTHRTAELTADSLEASTTVSAFDVDYRTSGKLRAHPNVVQITGSAITTFSGDTTGSFALEATQNGASSRLGSGDLNWLFGVDHSLADASVLDDSGDTLLKIGSGAFGSVYQGKWRGSSVAIKNLYDAGADSTDAYLQLRKLSSVNSNPLYEQKVTSGRNVLYERSAGSGENPLFEASNSARENVLYEHTGNSGENPLYEARMTAQGLELTDSLAGSTTIFRTNSIVTKSKNDVGPVKWMAPESIRLRNTTGDGGAGGAVAIDAMPDGAKVIVRGWDPEKKIVVSNDDATNENYIEFLDTSGTSRVKISDFGLSRLSSHVAIGTTEDLATLTVGGDICATGTIGACSDGRFKSDIQPIAHPLDLVNQLQGVTYRWNSDAYPEMHFSDKEQIGLIAQDVEEVLPEVVAQSSAGYKSIDYAKLTPLLIEAVKELRKQNTQKEAEIESLENRLANLERLLKATK